MSSNEIWYHNNVVIQHRWMSNGKVTLIILNGNNLEHVLNRSNHRKETEKFLSNIDVIQQSLSVMMLC